MRGTLLGARLSFFELRSWDRGVPSRWACNDERTRSLSAKIVDAPNLAIMREAGCCGLEVTSVRSG